MERCPQDDELVGYVEGTLSEAERESITAHLADCASCRQVIVAVVPADAVASTVAGAGEAATPRARIGLPPGTEVGRYRVRERLGSGGMGVVYAADDPELQRKVALKLLRPRTSSAPALEGLRARLLREAQVMARLRHPNVVTVFDVGAWQEQLFVAMELVQGRTLRTWLAEAERPWSEVLPVMRQAAAGLAAAHAAGVIHRDVKPDNVLVGDDGRVVVTDFGVAATEGPGGEAGEALDTGVGRLTVTGALLGTPRYMAPEQFAGRATDERTDVFGFCVTLYEALYRQSPFAGRTVGEIARAVESGQVREPARGSGVPGWLDAAVRKGLSPRPEDRFAGMAELERLLGRDPGRARRRALVAVGVAALVAAGTAAAVRTREAPCSGARARLATVWDGAHRDAVVRALGEGEVGGRVVGILDGWADRWAGSYTEACLATRVRREQSEQLLDARMECLSQRLRELGALSSILAQADKEVKASAIEAAHGLHAPGDCDDAASLLGLDEPRLGPGDAPRLERTRQQLAEAAALRSVGRIAPGIAAASEALDLARQLRHGPLVAEALQSLGELREDDGKYPEAERTLSEALWTAEEVRHDDLSLRAASLLVWVTGYRLQQLRASDDWSRFAFAKLARLHSPPRREAELRHAVAGVLLEQHRFPEAEEHARRALALFEQLSGPEHPEVAQALSHLGLVLSGRGLRDEAVQCFRRGVAIREKALGPDHLDVAFSLHNLGYQLRLSGRPGEALAPLLRSIEIRRRALGPRHPEVGNSEANLADALFTLGRHAEALEHARMALGISEETFGPQSPRGLPHVVEVSRDLLALGRSDEALAAAERAVRLAASTSPPTDTRLADALVQRGNVLGALGRRDAARADWREAFSRSEKAFGEGSVKSSRHLLPWAAALLEDGDAAGALALVDRILGARDGTASASTLAALQQLRARALAARLPAAVPARVH